MNTLEFDRLVQKYQSLVYTICHQLVPDEGDAQDLTQETFLAAWRNMSRCPVGYEKQWLARIASNKAKDYLRSAWARRMNTPGDAVLALEGAPPGSEPETQLLEALGEEELTQRILDLREPYKTPCRLVLLEQHTAAEAARAAAVLGRIVGVNPGKAVLVVELALLLIGEHLVRLVDLLELFLGFLVAGVVVRVVLHGQLAVSLLDLRIGGRLGYTQHFVVIAFLLCHNPITSHVAATSLFQQRAAVSRAARLRGPL